MKNFYLLCLALTTTFLFADDLLILKKGNKILKGKILELETEGIQFEISGAKTFFKNEDIAPNCLFEFHQARANLKEPNSVNQLAEFGVQLELYPEALRLYQTLIELDPNQSELVAPRIQEVTELAVEQLLEKAEEYQEQEDFEKAQKCYKSILSRYPNALKAQMAEEGLKTLAKIQEEEAKQAEKDAKQAGKDAEKAKIDEKTLKAQKYIQTAEDWILKGQSFNASALEYHGKGNITQATKNYENALSTYKKAITYLLGAKKYAKTDALKKQLYEIHSGLKPKQVQVFNNMAVMFMADKNWKRADALLKSSLKLDPTNPEALKLKAEVDENRVSFSASKRANVKPIISNN